MLDGPDAPAIPGNSRMMSRLPDPVLLPTAAPVVTLFTRDCQGPSAALRPINSAAAPGLAAFQNDRDLRIQTFLVLIATFSASTAASRGLRSRPTTRCACERSWPSLSEQTR